MARNDNFQQFIISDTQSQIVDKLNSNFKLATEKNGSILSITGETGPRGLIGSAGPAGPNGATGPKGNRWIVSSVAPDSDPILEYGDIWLDPNFNCYQLGLTGWIFIDSLKRDLGNFTEITGIFGTGGQTSGSAIKFNQTDPSKYSFVFSDGSPEFSGNLNPEGAKFVISTDPDLSGNYLAEFTRSDEDSTPGSTGTASDSSKHPVFSWEGLPNESNLLISSPKADFEIDFKTEEIEQNINFSNTGDFSISTYETGSYSLIQSQQVTLAANNVVSINQTGDFSLVSWGLSFFGSMTTGYSDESSRMNVYIRPQVYNPDGYFIISRGKTASNDHNSVTKTPLTCTVYYDPSTATSRQTNNDYAFALQTEYQGFETPFSVNNLGKIFVKKLSEIYDTTSLSIPVFPGASKGNPQLVQRINWYELPPPDETDARIFILDPSLGAAGSLGGNTLASGGALGVGFNLDKWAESSIFQKREVIEYTIYVTGTQPTSSSGASLSGISFVGTWTTSRPTTLGTDYYKFSYGSANPTYAFHKKIRLTIGYQGNGIFFIVPVGYNCDYREDAGYASKIFTFNV